MRDARSLTSSIAVSTEPVEPPGIRWRLDISYDGTNFSGWAAQVGRRTHHGVGRLLTLIEGLERRETDSDRLRELYRRAHN